MPLGITIGWAKFIKIPFFILQNIYSFQLRFPFKSGFMN